MKKDIKPDFEKFYEEGHAELLAELASTTEQIKQLMYGSYMAGYTLGLKEVTEALKDIRGDSTNS